MPWAIVKVDRDHPALTSDDSVAEFAEWLREQIARELSCSDPDGQLTAADIDVDIVDRDPKRHFGGTYDVKIVIFAGEYPDRRASLGQRRARLQQCLTAAYGPFCVRGYIWILPIAGEFGIF